jgi:MFS family permease
MSSIAPLAGRLTQIFSARNCIFVSSIVFSIGVLVTSQAPSFAVFLVGRAISGVGAAGILTISIILVLELTGKKRRGLFIGLVNAGYTSGVALGAVIAGALLPVTGWVSGYVVVGVAVADGDIESSVWCADAFGVDGGNGGLLQHSEIVCFGTSELWEANHRREIGFDRLCWSCHIGNSMHSQRQVARLIANRYRHQQ